MKLKDLQVERFKLEAPQTLSPVPGTEVYIHPLAGSGRVGDFPLERADGVFRAPQPGWLMDGRAEITLTPEEHLDVVVAWAKIDKPGPMEPIRVQPRRHLIGAGHTERLVWEILGGSGPSKRLRVGETVNIKGGWSSWPPHSFDKDVNNAPKFEEVFLPFLRPKDGTALLRRRGVYWDGTAVNDAVALRSGELVEVPLGLHPIVGGPDTDLMYCWFMVSPEPKVYGTWADDVGTYL